MKYLLIFSIFVLFFPLAYAEVKIPEGEYVGYFDSEGIYTVVGAIKNTGDDWIIPSVTVSILSEDVDFSKLFSFVPIGPNSEQPFKVKFPELVLVDPILNDPILEYEITPKQNPLNIDVIYDDTLITHSDGHKTGRIINNGEHPVDYLKVYALIYSEDGNLLDMGQSIEIFDRLNPGEIREFTIYPDPSVSSDAYYYSCFAVGDSSVVEYETIRKSEPYLFRYDSGAWFAYATFNDAGDKLTLKTQNSFPLEAGANLEFPRHSDTETFDVSFNGASVTSQQSLDEMGNWHVVFKLPAHSSGLITVSGFEDKGDVSSFENILSPSSESQTSDLSYLYYIAILPVIAIIVVAVMYKRRF